MSLIYTIESRGGKVELLCPACRKSIGQVTTKEAAELACAGVQPFCFECEPNGSDEMPKHIIAVEDSYFLGIGNWIFIGEWMSDDIFPDRKDLRMSQISLTTYFDLKTGKGVIYR